MARRGLIEIVAIATPEMGDRSYLVTDGRLALVVDPQRDVDRIAGIAAERGVRITHVVETHIHNDYVSGGLALARLTGARYGVSRDEPVAFAAERDPLAHGDRFAVGGLQVEVVATPGHTPHHLSYVVTGQGTDGRPAVAVFSGGSLLFGAAGRTDLVGSGLTDLLAEAQWSSIRHLASVLPAEATVHPTHGFGSFCAAGATGSVDGSTMGEERAVNPALLLPQRRFVEDLKAGLLAYPRYYAHMAPRNRMGATAPDRSAADPVDLTEMHLRVARGEWVVDLRARRAFAACHLAGTVNFEMGPQLATYLGWVFPWGSPLSLVGDDDEQLLSARRSLARIGLDDVAAQSIATAWALAREGEREGGLRSYPVATFADLDAHLAQNGTSGRLDGSGEEPLVLDVRHPHEWSAGHRPDARHIPVQDLAGVLATLPADRAIWVHCAAGYRAALAASLLDRHGLAVTLIDEQWRPGTPVTPSSRETAAA